MKNSFREQLIPLGAGVAGIQNSQSTYMHAKAKYLMMLLFGMFGIGIWSGGRGVSVIRCMADLQ